VPFATFLEAVSGIFSLRLQAILLRATPSNGFTDAPGSHFGNQIRPFPSPSNHSAGQWTYGPFVLPNGLVPELPLWGG